MFEEILGLPLHPLAVHAAVVLVPLLVLASLAYALVPRFGSRVGWAAVLLSVVAPLAAVTAALSGSAFQERRGLPLEGDLADHSDYGMTVMWVTIGLGVVTLGLYLTRRMAADTKLMTWLAGALTVLVVAAAGLAAIFVFLAGDLGSRMVWEELWENS